MDTRLQPIWLRGKLRLRDPESLGELNLGQVSILAATGDPAADSLEEGAFVGAHGGNQGRGVAHKLPPSFKDRH